MFLKLRGRGVQIALLVVSSLWMAATILPLSYSLLVPTADIKHVVWALEGKEILQGDLGLLVAQVTRSTGRLKRAVQVAAYWGASAEYKRGQSHTTKTTELSYLAWFEKRAKPTILIVTRTEVDGSEMRFYLNEGNPLGTLRVYVVPAAVLAFSIYWSMRKRSSLQTKT